MIEMGGGICFKDGDGLGFWDKTDGGSDDYRMEQGNVLGKTGDPRLSLPDLLILAPTEKSAGVSGLRLAGPPHSPSLKERHHRRVPGWFIYKYTDIFFFCCFHFLRSWKEAEGESGGQVGVVMW